MIDSKCIAIAQDTNSKGRYKHIDIRYKFIQKRLWKKGNWIRIHHLTGFTKKNHIIQDIDGSYLLK